MKAWLRLHQFALKDAVKRVISAPVSFLFNVLVIASALMLPLAGVTVLESVRPLSEQLTIAPELSVFLRSDLPRDKATELAPGIRQLLKQQNMDGSIDFVTREKALDKLKGSTALVEAVSAFGANPLPDAYVVKLAGFYDNSSAAALDRLATRLRAIPGVEHVQVDSSWVQRLAAFLTLAKLGLLILSAALGTIIMAVVFNTIRLQMMTHAEEIEISRLVGATNSYIYRPFYYSGALLGLVSGLASLVIVYAALGPLNSAIGEFSRLYGSAFELSAPSTWAISILLLSSSLLGFLASVICTRQYLRRR
ncbi:MAG: cell division protein FtsX [Burkholderiaceae bacterium]